MPKKPMAKCPVCKALVGAHRLSIHQRNIHGIAGELVRNSNVMTVFKTTGKVIAVPEPPERHDYLNLITEMLGESRTEASEFVWKVQHETAARPSYHSIYETLKELTYPYDTKIVAQRAARKEKKPATKPKSRKRPKTGVSIIYTPMGGMGGRNRRG